MIVYAADDEKAALYYLERMIRRQLPDQEILTFSRASELLQAFAEKPADVVFLDIEMPGMAGIELAEELKRIKEQVNIIFVTGFSEYAMDALNIFASGYVLKPCSEEKIRAVLNNLRYPVEEKKSIFVKTFGNFEVFYHGEPVKIRSPRSKELLAILINREGVVVSRQEVAAILFEDDYSRTKQAQLSHIATHLAEDLEAAGVRDFFFADNGYRVDMSLCECDAVEYLKGNSQYKYLGEYMEQYSWGEYRKEFFEKL